MPCIKEMLQTQQRSQVVAMSDRLFKQEVERYIPNTSPEMREILDAMHYIATHGQVRPKTRRNERKLQQAQEALEEMLNVFS